MSSSAPKASFVYPRRRIRPATCAPPSDSRTAPVLSALAHPLHVALPDQPVPCGALSRIDPTKLLHFVERQSRKRCIDGALEIVGAIVKALPDGHIELCLRDVLRFTDDLEALDEFPSFRLDTWIDRRQGRAWPTSWS